MLLAEVGCPLSMTYSAVPAQASLLVRHAPPNVADAFCASRLAGDGGRAFGTLPAGTDFGAILDRHRAG